MRAQVPRSFWGVTAPVLVGVTSGAAASPVPFQVNLGASRVYIKVGSAGRFGHDHGVQGQLASGRVDLGGTGELTSDMRSFVLDVPAARQYVGLSGTVSSSDRQKTTANMLGPHVLDVAHYPWATCAIASAAPLDGQAPGKPGSEAPWSEGGPQPPTRAFGASSQLLFVITVCRLFPFLQAGGRFQYLPAPAPGASGLWFWTDGLLALPFADLHSVLLLPRVRKALGRRIPSAHTAAPSAWPPVRACCRPLRPGSRVGARSGASRARSNWRWVSRSRRAGPP